jgi:hypothetical protein
VGNAFENMQSAFSQIFYARKKQPGKKGLFISARVLKGYHPPPDCDPNRQASLSQNWQADAASD